MAHDGTPSGPHIYAARTGSGSRAGAGLRPRRAAWALGAVLALGSTVGLPVTGMAGTPATDQAAGVMEETVGSTSDTRLPGRDSTPESGDWDGLVGLIVEYLDPAGELGAATARTDDALATPST